MKDDSQNTKQATSEAVVKPEGVSLKGTKSSKKEFVASLKRYRIADRTENDE